MKKHGYLGLIKSSDFIDGERLAKTINLTKGRLINSTSEWLHFILEGEEVLVPMGCFRVHVSWDYLYSLGVVYSDTEGSGPGHSRLCHPRDQNVFIDIAGDRYKVTLLKGLNNVTPREFPTDLSEWNRLMYRVHNGVWGEFSEEELGNEDRAFIGDCIYGSWCQEYVPMAVSSESIENGGIKKGTCSTMIGGNPVAIVRGEKKITNLTKSASNVSWHCWRPALRKI